MAKKTRKQKQRTATRRPAGAAPQLTAQTAARPAAGSTAHDETADSRLAPLGATQLEAPGDEARGDGGARRRVGRVGPLPAAGPASGRQQRVPLRSARFGSAAAMVEPLDSDDPAIPFDRVPYVPSDLRRVAVIATMMVVLIVIAWVIVSNVVD